MFEYFLAGVVFTLFVVFLAGKILKRRAERQAIRDAYIPPSNSGFDRPARGKYPREEK